MRVLTFLLGICLPSRWSLSFPLHALALIPLSFAHLDSLPLMIWYSGQTALFLLLLARAAPAFLPTAFSVATLFFFFWQAQHVPVFWPEACAILQALCWSRQHQKSAISLLLLSDSRSVLSSIFPFISISLAGTVFSPPVLSDCNGSLDTHFSRGTTRLMSWRALLAPSAIPCSPSLISRIHSCLFSDWRRTVSFKFFHTQVPSISTEKPVLLRHARCVLSRFRCNGYSLLLGSYLSRIGRIENPFCSACGNSSQDISHLILHCPATDSLRRSLFGDSLSLYDLWSRPWGIARLLALHDLPPCPHPSEGVG